MVDEGGSMVRSMVWELVPQYAHGPMWALIVNSRRLSSEDVRRAYAYRFPSIGIKDVCYFLEDQSGERVSIYGEGSGELVN